MIPILLDIPMADALRFAGLMLVAFLLSFVVVGGTGRGAK